ncbi:MAG: peptidoglycan DL-endopeptidase CwlO [Actinomycetota bacterium]
MLRSNALKSAATVLALILGLGSLSTLVANQASADPVASKKAEAARISAELSRLANRAEILTEDWNEARVKSSDLDAKTRNAAADLAATAAKAQVASNNLKKMATAAYIRGGLDTQRSSATTDGVDPGRAEYYIHSTANNQRDAIDELRQAKLVLAERQSGLAAARDQARRQLNQMSAKRKAAASAVAAQQALLNKVTGDLARLVAADQARRTSPARSSARPSRGRLQGTPPGADAPAPNPAAGGAVAEAKRQLGKPYHYGGSGPDSFDCSGLTSWAWRVGGGRSLPHSSRAQYSATSRVSMNEIAPGDLVFFGSSVGSIHHVGIYVGGGQMVDAPETGRNVQYAYAFRGDLVGIGRVN